MLPRMLRIALVLFAGVAASGREKERTLSLAEAHALVLPSVLEVRVVAECQGMLTTSVGTGFLVSSAGWVVTARHVLLPDCAAKREQHVLFAAGRVGRLSTGFTPVSFSIVDEEPVYDLAILCLLKNPFRGEVHTLVFGSAAGRRQEVPVRYGMAILDESNYGVGAPIAVSGYALNDRVEVVIPGVLATDSLFEPELIRSLPSGVVGGQSSVFYLASLLVNSGHSGSPVYSTRTGKVIGVCIGHLVTPILQKTHEGPFGYTPETDQQLGTNAGIAIIVPSHYVRLILDRAHERGKQER